MYLCIIRLSLVFKFRKQPQVQVKEITAREATRATRRQVFASSLNKTFYGQVVWSFELTELGISLRIYQSRSSNLYCYLRCQRFSDCGIEERLRNQRRAAEAGISNKERHIIEKQRKDILRMNELLFVVYNPESQYWFYCNLLSVPFQKEDS